MLCSLPTIFLLPLTTNLRTLTKEDLVEKQLSKSSTLKIVYKLLTILGNVVLLAFLIFVVYKIQRNSFSHSPNVRIRRDLFIPVVVSTCKHWGSVHKRNKCETVRQTEIERHIKTVIERQRFKDRDRKTEIERQRQKDRDRKAERQRKKDRDRKTANKERPLHSCCCFDM